MSDLFKKLQTGKRVVLQHLHLAPFEAQLQGEALTAYYTDGSEEELPLRGEEAIRTWLTIHQESVLPPPPAPSEEVEASAEEPAAEKRAEDSAPTDESSSSTSRSRRRSSPSR